MSLNARTGVGTKAGKGLPASLAGVHAGDLPRPPKEEKALWKPIGAMEESEESFRLLVESVTDYAIFMLDPEGRVASWNAGAERSKGYKAKEILGRHYSVFFPAEAVAAGLPERELEEAKREGRFQAEAWRVRKDGTRFWALVTLTAIRGPEGRLRGFAKVTRDLTEQKAAEEQLQARNAELDRYRIILENVLEYVIFSMDPEGRITSWPRGAQKVSGAPAEQMLGRHYSVFFSPEDVAAGVPEAELAEAARLGQVAVDGWRHKPNGARIWSSCVLTAVRDKEGGLTGFVRVARVMTEQKEAETALRELNAQLDRYRIIVESIDQYFVYTLDTEGRISSWETGAQKQSGIPPEQMLGKPYAMFFLPEDQAAGVPQQQLEEAARTGRFEADAWMMTASEERVWSSGVLTAVRDETGRLTGFLRVARNMTRQKVMEIALERLAGDLELRVKERTAELEETVAELERKNAEVEAFVYIVSHDLRAPLVNVQGFSSELGESCQHLRLLLQSDALPAEFRETAQEILDQEMAGALRFISASASKFERLIDALLRLSRQGRQVYRFCEVDVQELVGSTIASLHQQLTEAGATMKVGVLPPAYADMGALDQVFSNLMGNSLKYRSGQRALQLEVGGEVDGAMVHYWVRDNGLGIPAHARAKLFQVFQRFHRQQAEGEGMGLAIVHRIVERHGGKIWVESEEGVGSTFHFSLPREASNAPRAGDGQP